MSAHFTRKIFASLAGVMLTLACSFVVVHAQTQLPQAEIIEKVTCQSEPSQSYALFLPPGYTPEKKWPILYAFDPVGRGSVPVKLYQAAASRFGFIVVGSNNSRNGIDVSAIVKTLWTDTHERFSIDERRVYTTGFSGGARIALAVALGYRGAIAGVIAASGGLPPSARLPSSNQFVFFGTAGTEDFNFPEMQQLKRKLDDIGITNRLSVFAGGHDWPPSEMCSDAIGWLEVQAMKAGTRASDDKLVDERLGLKTKAAHEAELALKLYDAYLEYEALASEFKGLRDTSEFTAAALRLRDSREVRAGIKNERAEEENQANLTSKLQNLIGQLENSETYPEAIAQLKSNLSDLAKRSEDGKSLAEQRVAKRVLGSLTVRMYEESFALRQKQSYASIPAKLELLVLIRPKDPRAFYELAAAYARIGNKGRATAALGRAIERGFSDVGRIEQNEDFAILRDEVEFKKLIAGLKKS